MPHFLADIHLTRARFAAIASGKAGSVREAEVAKESLAQARSLIERHHYGRRLPELAINAAAMSIRPQNLIGMVMDFPFPSGVRRLAREMA